MNNKDFHLINLGTNCYKWKILYQSLKSMEEGRRIEFRVRIKNG